jgi:hypothetical protein
MPARCANRPPARGVALSNQKSFVTFRASIRVFEVRVT